MNQGILQAAQHEELRLRHAQRFFLEGVGAAVDDEEADQVTGRPDGQLAELERLGRPVRECPIPRQVEQGAGAVAQAETRERRPRRRGVGQSFFRRYAATDAS